MNDTAKQLAAAAVAATSITAVAQRVGVSRTGLSTYLAGKYPAGVRQIEARIVAALGVVECPYLGAPIGYDQCRAMSGRADPPAQSARLVAHWRACQGCVHRAAVVAVKEAA
jgi:AcrR family transcriptional regulator